MILKEIESELKSAEGPVAKILRKGENFNVLAIGFRKNMLLKKHKSNVPARIVVIKGEVVYNDKNGATKLGLYEEFEIPVEEMHWVESLQDSLMLVIKGS